MVASLPPIASRLVVISIAVLGLLLICSSELVSGNQPPAFEDFQSYLYLPDNRPVGSLILRLRANDVDDQVLMFSVALSDGDEGMQNILSIEKDGPKSANVVLARSLNSSVKQQYKFIFRVSDGTNVPIEKPFVLFVTPSSFSPPSILNLPKTVTVPEDVSVGTQVYKVSASDPLSAVTFDIQDESNKFTMDELTGIVTVTGKLDYHVQMTHILVVMASNRKALNTTSTLTVNVTNSKNRPPYFLESYYSASITENWPQGASVFVMRAFDGNTDLHEGVAYKFVAGHQNLFAINSTSGLITTLNKMDCTRSHVRNEAGCNFNIIIEACERPLKQFGSICSTVLLVVSVNDSNDHVPSFSLPSYDCYVYKYAPPNSAVGCDKVVSVIDSDAHLGNNKFIFSTQPLNASETFDIRVEPNSTNLILRVKNNSYLIMESSNLISVKITAKKTLATEMPPISSTINLHILGSTDIPGCYDNNSSLTFTRDEYKVILNGLPSIGSTIVTVTTKSSLTSPTDSDVIYSIRGRYAKIFSINEKTGDVSLSRPDLIATTDGGICGFPVVAKNRSRSQELAIAAVVVNIDLEELTKTVQMSFDNYVAILEENSLYFLKPLFIKAQVITCDKNPTIYYFMNKSEFSANFSIDPSSGEIRPQTPLDYEALPLTSSGMINLTVGAKMVGRNGDSGSLATVTVFLKDLNDNQPKFLHSSYSFFSKEPFMKGLVGKVFATDNDATRPNNQIIYSLKSSLLLPTFIDGEFSIDPITGFIYYVSSSSSPSFTPSSLKSKNQTLFVVATDLGTPSLSSTVTVTIQYVFESTSSSSSSCSAPSNVYSVEVNLSATPGSVIFNLPESLSLPSNGINGTDRDANLKGFKCFLTNIHLYDGKYRPVSKLQGVELFVISGDCTHAKLGISMESNYKSVRTILATLSVSNENAFNTSSERNDIATVLFFVNPYKYSLDHPIFLPGNVDFYAEINSHMPDLPIVGKLVAVLPLDLDRAIQYNTAITNQESAYFEINKTSGIIRFNKQNMDFSFSRVINITVAARTTSYDSPTDDLYAVVGPVYVESKINFSLRVIACTSASFKQKSVVVGFVPKALCRSSTLVDLKEYTINWIPETFYEVDGPLLAVPVADSGVKTNVEIKNFLFVSKRGLITIQGFLYNQSTFRLEVDISVSTPNCGEPSTTRITVILLSDENLVQIIVRSPSMSNYTKLTESLSEISSLNIFIYIISGSGINTNETQLIVFCLDKKSDKLLSFLEFKKLLNHLDNTTVSRLYKENNVVDILPYPGNVSSPMSLPSSSTCLPFVIALSIMCSLFLLFVVFLVSVYFCFKNKQKKNSKAAALSYSNSMALEGLGTERNNRDDDKEGSTATTNSSMSDSSDPTSTTANSAMNFILKRTETDGPLSVAAGQRLSYIYDSLKSTSAKENKSSNVPTYTSHYNSSQSIPSTSNYDVVRMTTNSYGSLSSSHNSKVTDSAIGSTDNFATNRPNGSRFTETASVIPPPRPSTVHESTSSLYSMVNKKGKVDGGESGLVAAEHGRGDNSGMRYPPSYEDLHDRMRQDVGSSFYI